MNDQMNPLVQFSPLSGALTLQNVSGGGSTTTEFENEVAAAKGSDRTMYAYAPRSGCPDPKQTQILFVLRNDASESSASRLLHSLQLRELSEEEHFLVLFPNPSGAGWNVRSDPDRDNDLEFLVRCFDVLKDSPLKVNGFNGMLFYLAADPESSALMAEMAARRPASVSAMMTGPLPEDYHIPEDALGVETAAWCFPGPVADYLKKANGIPDSASVRTGTASGGDPSALHEVLSADDSSVQSGTALRREKEHDVFPVEELRGRNPECRLFISAQPLSAETVRTAWDRLFCVTRRWQNDTYGHYQPRIAFTDKGFIAHFEDSSLGVNDGFPHTWYEYVPPQLRGSKEKAPLVLYFHGINCVPLYGAEQSLWHDLADRDGFIVVFPAPARAKTWNIYDLPNLVSDVDFTLALLDHLKASYAIDESRIYCTGFSMGGMMTHALTAAYPEIFAAGAACNAFAMARYRTPYQMLAPFLRMTEEEMGSVSRTALLADEKKAARPSLRMPIFQNVGEVDGLVCRWPAAPETGPAADDSDPSTCDALIQKQRALTAIDTKKDARIQTLRYWKAYNEIPLKPDYDPDAFSGLAADESFYEDPDRRFFHQKWFTEDAAYAINPTNPINADGTKATVSEGEKCSLLELVVAKRMAHAIDPVQIEMAWDFLRRFRRAADGTLFAGRN